jgi:hypothetical protein
VRADFSGGTEFLRVVEEFTNASGEMGLCRFNTQQPGAATIATSRMKRKALRIQPPGFGAEDHTQPVGRRKLQISGQNRGNSALK